MRGVRKINSHNSLQRLLIVKVGCMLKNYEDNVCEMRNSMPK